MNNNAASTSCRGTNQNQIITSNQQSVRNLDSDHVRHQGRTACSQQPVKRVRDLSTESAQTNSLVNAVRGISLVKPRSDSLSDIVKLSITIDRFKNSEHLISFLNEETTLRDVKKLSRDDQIKITRKIFFERGTTAASYALVSLTGFYLASLPTDNETLVNVIGQTITMTLNIHRDNEYYVRGIKNSLAVNFSKNRGRHLPEAALPNYLLKKLYIEAKGTIRTLSAYQCGICMKFLLNDDRVITDHKAYHERVGTQFSMNIVKLDDPVLEIIYHSAFRSALKSKALSHRASELMPVPLFENDDSVNRVLYFTRFNKAALIFPELCLTEEMVIYIEQNLNNLMQDTLGKIPEALRENLKNCFKKAHRLPYYISFFNELGELLRSEYEITNKTMMPSIPVKELYTIKEILVPSPALENKLKASEFADETKQAISYVIKNNRFARYIESKKEYTFSKNTEGLFEQALDRIAKNDFKPGSSPIFIGFVPESIANTIARENGFYDSNWSLNSLHGEKTHALVLTALTNVVDLKKSMLELIVDNNLWDDLMDMNRYRALSVDDSSSLDCSIPFIQAGITYALNYDNPFIFHELLLTGTLSGALNDIDQVIQQYEPDLQSHLLNIFTERIGVEQLTSEKLREMAININSLEVILASQHRQSMDQIQQFDSTVPDYGNVFENKSAGQFTSDFRSIALIRERARRYFLSKEEKFEVKGIANCNTKGGNSDCYQVLIEKVEDIAKFNCFIAHRKSRALRPPPLSQS